MKLTIESTRGFVEHDKKIDELLEFLDQRIELLVMNTPLAERLEEARISLHDERKRLAQNFVNQFLSDDTGVVK